MKARRQYRLRVLTGTASRLQQLLSTLATNVTAAPGTIYLAFLVTAEGRAWVFDNGAQSTGSAVTTNALPTITSLVQQLDSNGSATGGWLIQVAFPAGSSDAGDRAGLDSAGG